LPQLPRVPHGKRSWRTTDLDCDLLPRDKWEEVSQARTEKARKENAEMVAQWIAGKPDSHPDTLMHVRGEEIETSRGARFPLDHGKRAWPFILAARGKGWHSNGHTIKLGNFCIDSINAEGDVKAGCHLVKWPEVERIARELGLIEQGAAS
jgi:hypothetical protein